MARRPPPGKCVHCLASFDELTWDHVFPLGWYPEGTPDKLEKWKIPSCLDCDQLHSKSEGDLLVKMGMCVDPEDPQSAGIAEKALRATRAHEGRNKRDARLREAKRQKILAQVLEGVNIPRQAIFPGFGPFPGQAMEDQVAVPVSAKAIHRLAEKVVRGLVYVIDGQLIEPPYAIHQYVLDEAGSHPVRTALDKFGQVFQRGPGIKVRRARPVEDERSGFYEVEIWGRLKLYVSVMDSEREKAT